MYIFSGYSFTFAPGDPATERTLYSTAEQIEIKKQFVGEVTSEVGVLFSCYATYQSLAICYLSVLLKSCWFDSHLYVSVCLSHFIIGLLDLPFH